MSRDSETYYGDYSSKEAEGTVRVINMAAEELNLVVATLGTVFSLKEAIVEQLKRLEDKDLPWGLIEIFSIEWKLGGEFVERDRLEDGEALQPELDRVRDQFQGLALVGEEGVDFRYVCRGPDEYIGEKNEKRYLEKWQEQSRKDKNNFKYFHPQFRTRDALATQMLQCIQSKSYGIIRWKEDKEQDGIRLEEVTHGLVLKNVVSTLGDPVEKLVGFVHQPMSILRQNAPAALVEVPQINQLNWNKTKYPRKIPKGLTLRLAEQAGCEIKSLDFLIDRSVFAPLIERRVMMSLPVIVVWKYRGVIILDKYGWFTPGEGTRGSQIETFCKTGHPGMNSEEELQHVHEFRMEELKILVASRVEAVTSKGAPVQVVDSYDGKYDDSHMLQFLMSGASKWLMNTNVGTLSTGNSNGKIEIEEVGPFGPGGIREQTRFPHEERLQRNRVALKQGLEEIKKVVEGLNEGEIRFVQFAGIVNQEIRLDETYSQGLDVTGRDVRLMMVDSCTGVSEMINGEI